VYVFAMTLFFSAAVLQICVSWWAENTIRGMTLFWQSAVAGILLAIITTVYVKWKSPSFYREGNKGKAVHFGIFAGFAFFIPALAIFVNHVSADKYVTCKNYTIDHLSKSGGRNRSSWLYIIIDGKEERFKIKSGLHDALATHTQVQLCTRKGKLGYEFAASIRPAAQE
jgi:hypothetical protein